MTVAEGAMVGLHSTLLPTRMLRRGHGIQTLLRSRGVELCTSRMCRLCQRMTFLVLLRPVIAILMTGRVGTASQSAIWRCLPGATLLRTERVYGVNDIFSLI